MDLGLEGTTALVTGASKGIGRAVAERLAAEGARVAVSARDAQRVEEVVTAIGAAGGEAVGVIADVSDAAGVQRALRGAEERFGPILVLVVNAGGPPASLPTDLADPDWQAAVDLTLMSAVRLAKGALPGMRRAGWGRIVNITSLSVPEPIPNLTLSNALRSAVTAYAKTLSLEVAAEGITVNSVAPGYTATERVEELYPDAEAKRALVARIPARRLARPEEIGAAVAFLASKQAAYITGQSLLVDGGMVRALRP